LAKCWVAECDRCDRGEGEKEAIAWINQKRMLQYNENHIPSAHIDFNIQVRSYCAVFDERSSKYNSGRSRRIRASTFDKPLHIKDVAFWQSLRELALRFFRGEVQDPHPRAMHFGGMLDIQLAKLKGLIVVAKYCNKHGKWCNYFYRTKYGRYASDKLVAHN